WRRARPAWISKSWRGACWRRVSQGPANHEVVPNQPATKDLECQLMNLQKLFRRNRFKKPAKVEKPARQWPLVLREWRSYARRAALLVLIAGALAALTWGLDRPIRVISMDGAFQRVSPGQVE